MNHRLKAGILAIGALISATLPLASGHDGTRLLQVFLLSLPVWLWLFWWPGRTQKIRQWQALIFAGSSGLFILDGAVRGFIDSAYQSTPAATMVITAISNTSAQESWEFMQMNWPALLSWKGLTAGSLVMLAWTLRQWCRLPVTPVQVSQSKRGLQLVIVILLSLVYVIKPWREHHPLIFWPTWASQVKSLRDDWSNLVDKREQMVSSAQAQTLTLTKTSPDTMVIVLGESINRSHMSVYGYARETTPELGSRMKDAPEKFGLFRHAWSVDASTVPSLRNFFYFGEPRKPQQHLLALASAAGYETWWISNHDDLAIKQEHARFAQHMHMLNKIPGRSSQSLDEVTLPVLEKALGSSAKRKLIVLHLLGGHPHYELRYPQNKALFGETADSVDLAMKEQGRSAWTRRLRNAYDSAVTYHDGILAASLDLTRKKGGHAIWLYFSDHGQDVGSRNNFAGHSSSTPDGYRIPLLMWGQPIGKLPPETFERIVRSDWLGYSVMRLLGIEWSGQRFEQDVLDPGYRWLPPEMPLSIDFAS